MQAQGIAGPQVAFDGAQPSLRQGRLGELIDGNSVGKYYELGRRGQMFTASMQAAASLGTALTASAVTLTLWNPIGSTVNLAILQTAVNVTAITSAANAASIVYAASLGLSTGLAPTATTPAKVASTFLGGTNANIGGATPVGQCYTAATLGATAPIAVRNFPLVINQSIANATPTSMNTAAIDYVDGALIVGPGTAVTIQSIATVAPSGIISWVWAEIPN